MKKAFTLIELLAVIIILAIIALITTPVVLNVVSEAKEKADMESANGIVDSARLYKSEAMLDSNKQTKVDNLEDIYSDVILYNKPEFGELYVNNKGLIAMAVIINNKCYYKEFTSGIEIREVSNCDLGYVGDDTINPTISQEVISGTINENGWYKEDVYINVNVVDNESGVSGYKRCISQAECEPDETIYTNSTIILSTESANNYVCVIGVDKQGNESSKDCEIYKIDKTKPTIEGIADKVINKDESIDLLNGVSYNDALSGINGSIVIEPVSIDTSVAGTKQVSYSVTDVAGNNHTVIRNIVIDALAPTITYEVLNNPINSNGWANSDFYVSASIIDNSGTGIKSAKSCVVTSSSECEPIADISGLEKTFYISTEGNNRACIEVIDNNDKTTKLCSDIYKLDKTLPIAGTININGTIGSNGWYTSDVSISVVNGSDALSGHNNTSSNISSITTNTTGTNVIVTTTDLAGNISTRSYTIKLDKTAPILSLNTKTIESNTSVNILVNALDSDSSISILNYYMKNQSSENYVLYQSSQNNSYTYIGLDSNYIYNIKVIAIDLAGNSSELLFDLTPTSTYVYEKYALIKTYTYKLTSTDYTQGWFYGPDNFGNAYEGYAFNTSTGTITGQTLRTNLVFTCGVYTGTAKFSKTYYKISSDGKRLFTYFYQDKTDCSIGPDIHRQIWTSEVQISSTNYSWGNYMYDVTAADQNTYPDNGRIGDYGYKFKNLSVDWS